MVKVRCPGCQATVEVDPKDGPGVECEECGKKFRLESVAARPGWECVPAVAQRQLHEIKSSIILQPGPAALTEGVQAMQKVMKAWQQVRA